MITLLNSCKRFSMKILSIKNASRHFGSLANPNARVQNGPSVRRSTLRNAPVKRAVQIQRTYHSRVTEGIFDSDVNVIVVPLMEDNYAYIVNAPSSDDPNRRVAAVVDPGEAEPVHRILRDRNLNLRYILATHHHADHIAGIADLIDMQMGASIEVVGGDERIDRLDTLLTDGDSISLSDSVHFRAMLTPCHTSKHMSYVMEVRQNANETELNENEKKIEAAFVGDTLFASGCGRFFEGDAAQMLDSLTRIATLPPDTRLYFGHEYTTDNLRFALSIEPDNGHLVEKAAWCAERRTQALPTTPTTVEDELTCNLFLRCRERALAKRLGFLEWSDSRQSHVATMAALRERKDTFR